MKKRFFEKNNKDDDRSTRQKIEGIAFGVADFFDPEPEKEKILRHEDFGGVGDEYYAVVSSRYKIVGRLFAVLCVLFLLISILTNISNITYENLFYFAREFGSAVDMASVDHETVSYDVYKDQNFTLYRGGLAAVSPSNVSLYTATGRKTFGGRSSYVAPFSVASKKYLLVYDVSGNGFSLYNSFSKVYSETFDNPITDAAISESGVFAVVTRSSEFKTVINVYSDKINIVGRYSHKDYAIDVAIDNDGKRMAVLYYSAGDGTGITELKVYDITRSHESDEDGGLGRVMLEERYIGVFPLACTFFDNGDLSVVTDGMVTVFDEKYNVTKSIGFIEEISAFCADSSGVALALRSGALNGLNRVIAFDQKGELIYDALVNSSAEGIGINGRYVFLKSTNGVLRLDTNGGGTEIQTCPTGKLIVYNEDTAIVCGDSSASYIKFNK